MFIVLSVFSKLEDIITFYIEFRNLNKSKQKSENSKKVTWYIVIHAKLPKYESLT